MDVNNSSGSAELTARREETRKLGLTLADFRALLSGTVLSRTSPAGEGPQQMMKSMTQSTMIRPAKHNNNNNHQRLSIVSYGHDFRSHGTDRIMLTCNVQIMTKEKCLSSRAENVEVRYALLYSCHSSITATL